MEFMELERLIDLIRKSRAEAIIKLKSPEKAESSLTSRPFFFSKLQATFLLPDWLTPVINQHWFQIALWGVSTVFYPLLAVLQLLASLVQKAVKLMWKKQLQLECLRCWICCEKQNWTTTNKLFPCWLISKERKKNVFKMLTRAAVFVTWWQLSLREREWEIHLLPVMSILFMSWG